MNADIKGALNQINTSYKAFVHNEKPMSKEQVKKVLEYGLAKGYKHTGQLTDEEIDAIINPKETRLSYAERLEKDVQEIKEKYKGCEEMIQEIKMADLISGMEIDYEVERTHMKYKAVEKFVKGLNEKI